MSFYFGRLPYPFADDEFEESICRDASEHFRDVLGFINELQLHHEARRQIKYRY